MEDGAVVVALAVDFLPAGGVGPVLGALGEPDEVGCGQGSFLIKELTGKTAGGGIEDCAWTGGHGRRLGLHRGTGRVGKLARGLRWVLGRDGRRSLRGQSRGAEDKRGDGEDDAGYSGCHLGFTNHRLRLLHSAVRRQSIAAKVRRASNGARREQQLRRFRRCRNDLVVGE